MNQDELLQLLQEQPQQPQQQDLGQWLQGGLMNEDERKDPMMMLQKILSPLSGIGSIPDVIHETNNPLDVATMGPRYLLNILKGIGGGMLPFVKPPEFKSASDVMKKWNLSTGNDIADGVIGFGADVALDPTTWLGGAGLLGKVGKGAKLAKGADIVSMAGKEGGKVLPQRGVLNVLTEYMNPNKLKINQKTGSTIMNGMRSGIRPGRDAKQLLVELLTRRSNGMLLPNQMTGSLIMP